MKGWKRGMALLLCLLLCLGILPGTAWGAEAKTDGGVAAENARITDNGTIRSEEESAWFDEGAVVEPSATAVSRSTVEAKLAQLAQTYPPGSTWTGSFAGGIQCYGFAKMILYHLFGKTDSGAYRSWNYAGDSLTGLRLVDQIANYSESTVKNLLSKAAPGDLLQFSGGTKSQHSMIVYSVSSTSVCIYECNWDNACGISKTDISFAKFANRGTNRGKLSLIRADNYDVWEPIEIDVRASTTKATSPDVPDGGVTFNQGDVIFINGRINSGGPMTVELYVTPPGGTESGSPVDSVNNASTWFWLGSGADGYKLTQSGTYFFRLHAISGGNTKDYAAQITSVALDTTVHVTGVSLDKSALELQISSWQGGTSGTLYATVYPSNATDKSMTWSSSNTAVATVDGNGTVTATGPGSATITVRTNDGGKTASCAVTVVQKYYLDLNGCRNGENQTTLAGLGTADVYVNGVLRADDVEDYCVLWPAGTTYEFCNIKPYDGRSYNGIASGARQGTINGDSALVLDFTTINTSDIGSPAATLTENGHIYRYYSDAVTWYTAKQFCEEQGGHLATVSSEAENTLLRNLIGNNLAWLGGTCISGSWKWVTGEAFSFGATGKTYPWKSTEPNDSPSDEGGENYLHFSGTLWNDNAGCYRCGFLFEKEVATYTIQYNANGGSGAPAAQTKTQGVPLTLSSTVPTRSGYTFLGWAESQSATAAQYQPSGSFTKDANTTLYAVWKSNVVSVTGVTLNKTSLTLNKGACETLTATVSPSNATNKSVTWSSSNTSVATVDSNGKVTAVSAGTATVTVKTNDGGKTATCAVTVKPKTYTITYDANGGTGAPAAQTKTQDVTLTISSIVPTRTGYTFLGWAESSTATTAQYQPGGSFTKNANTTLYAVWQAAPAANTATISVGSATGQAGTTVNVPIALKNNPGIISMMLQVQYDSSTLTLVGCTDSGNLGTAYHNQDFSMMPYVLSWGDDTATADNTYNGEIVVLHFQIKEGTADGNYPVSVRYSLDDMDIYNSSFEPVSFATVSGGVKVSAVRIGDVNGDQKVNGMDRTFLARHVAKWNGYGQSDIVYTAADVNTDGKVNSMDRTILARHIAKWNGYSELPYHPAGGNSTAQPAMPDAVLLEASGEPCIRVSSAEAMPGENVDVTVSLENNPGLISMLLSVEYDDSVLTLTGCTDAGKLGTPYHSPSFGTPYTLSWGDDTATSDNTYSGVIVTLHFTVHPDAEAGAYPITISYDEDEPDIYNSDFESIHFELLPGTVAVGGGTPVHTHTMTHVPAADPTCTEPGNIEYWYCAECGKYFSDANAETELAQEDTVIPPKGHTPGEAVRENEVPAICTEPGSYDAVVYCTVCGAELSRETVTVPALGHDWGEWTETKAPSCTEPGEETRTCKRDGTHKETREIPPKGHTPGEAVRENEVPATCTEPGSYDAVIYCTVCGAELSRETVTVPALGHDWGEWTETKAPSCTEPGEETRTCKRDGTHKETREIPPTGHSPGEAVHENEVPATCTEPGSYDEVVYCTVCGAELSRETVTVPALGHDWGDWTETQAPSCTEAGEEARTCKRDGTHKETREIPPTGHAPGEAVHENEVPATCTEAGSYDEVVYCTACGAELSRDSTTVPALGHDWSDWTATTEATCTEAGEESRSCKRCGETETRVMTEPEDHDWGDWKLTTKPGCIRSGQETRVCAHCGETETRPVEALGHRWGEWAVTKQPTATETGTETIRCLRCGRTMTRTVPCLTMPFTDVPEDAWYYEAVHKVWTQGLMTGVSDTLFAPGQSCERGMIVTILYRLAGAPEAGTSGFLDVAEGDWYADAVAWAEAEGIVYGYDETHFFPRTPITREQLAAMQYRYAAWAGLDVSAADGLTDYADAEAVSAYALEAMRWAVAQELLFGTEAQRMEPDAEATRTQTAAALARFTELAD